MNILRASVAPALQHQELSLVWVLNQLRVNRFDREGVQLLGQSDYQ